MMRGVRHPVAVVAFLLGGLASVPGITAEAIGDPWWDEAVSANSNADPQALPVDPVRQAHDRSRRHGQHAAMNVLRRELSLVRATCPSLSAEDRAVIVAAGARAVEVTAAAAQPIVRGNLRVVAPEGVVEGRMPTVPGSTATDPTKSVMETVAKAVAKVAPPAEAEEYRREVTARADRRRAAVIAAIVEAVDQKAMLDDAQRKALSVALAGKWQPAWEVSPGSVQGATLRINVAQLPGVSVVVADVLGPEEFSAWQERLRRPAGS